MAELNFSQLTPDNGAIRELSELLFLETIDAPSITQFHTIETGVHNGDKAGFIGEMGLVGQPGTGCEPEYNNTPIAAAEKTWDIGEWEVPEKICWADLKSTLVKYAMRTKTDQADLTGTEYIDLIVEPRMELALRKMLWRLAWFGDKGANNIGSGGLITDGVDTKFFKVTDGFFKRLNAIIGTNPLQRVAIAANASATYDAQRDGFGDALTVTQSLITRADIRLRGAENRMIMCTQLYADAFSNAIRTVPAYTEPHWEALFDGITRLRWDGVDMYAIPLWDEMINAYENNGTKWNNPFRAVFTTPTNLAIGTPSEDTLADLQLWFERKEQMNYMLARDDMGTMIKDDSLVQYAV